MRPIIIWDSINRDSVGFRDRQGVLRWRHTWDGKPRPEVCSLLRARRGGACLALLSGMHRGRSRAAWGALRLAAAVGSEGKFSLA